jgi:hypothetical protein
VNHNIGDIGSDAPGSAARSNSGKPNYFLLPLHLLESTVRVFEAGAEKYAPWNWATGTKLSVPIGCMYRHLAAFHRGEDLDPETGEHHLAHVICNCLIAMNSQQVYEECDDRPVGVGWSGGSATNKVGVVSPADPKILDSQECADAVTGSPEFRDLVENIYRYMAARERFKNGGGA